MLQAVKNLGMGLRTRLACTKRKIDDGETGTPIWLYVPLVSRECGHFGVKQVTVETDGTTQTLHQAAGEGGERFKQNGEEETPVDYSGPLWFELLTSLVLIQAPQSHNG